MSNTEKYLQKCTVCLVNQSQLFDVNSQALRGANWGDDSRLNEDEVFIAAVRVGVLMSLQP